MTTQNIKIALDLLVLMIWNACSIVPKKAQLIKFLEFYNVDVAVITETHLIPQEDFNIAGYEVIRKDRSTGEKGGGVIILVRNTRTFHEIDVNTSVIEAVGIELMLANKKLKIYGAYWPQQCNKKNAKYSTREVKQQCQEDLKILTRSKGEWLVCGDLNARHKLWMRDNESNPNGEMVFADQLNGKYMVYLPFEPTYLKSKNGFYLDICLTNITIDEPKTVYEMSSDHYPTLCKVHDAAHRPEKGVTTRGQARLTKESILQRRNQEEVPIKSANGANGTAVTSSNEQQDDYVLYIELKKSLDKFIGMHRAKSSSEAIFTLRQILQKCREFRVPTYHLFVNLRLSYTTINREVLWQNMRKIDCLKTLIQPIQTMVDGMFPNSPLGLKHDDELSSLLMTIAVETVIRGANIPSRGTIFQNDLQSICYKDDVVIIAKDLSILERAYTDLKKVAVRIGMVMGPENIKYMKTSTKSKQKSQKTREPFSPKKVSLAGDTYDAVAEVEFLGSMFTVNNDLGREIDHRIDTVKQDVEKYLNTSTDKTIHQKVEIYVEKIRPKLLHGHESWIMVVDDNEKVVDCEWKVLKNIHGKVSIQNGKKVFDHTHPVLVQKLKLECGIEPLAKIGRLQWAGQVMRMPKDCPARIVLESNPQGGRNRGRQPSRWIEHVETDLKNIKRFENWRIEAEDAKKWDRVVKDAKESWLGKK